MNKQPLQHDTLQYVQGYATSMPGPNVSAASTYHALLASGNRLAYVLGITGGGDSLRAVERALLRRLAPAL